MANPVANNILDLSKFKGFADDNSVFSMIENILGKEEMLFTSTVSWSHFVIQM